METQTVEVSNISVSEQGIDLPKANNKKALVSLGKNFNNVNSALSDLAQLDADCQEELIDVRTQIAELTGQLKARQKELRQTVKAIGEKRLLKLGERSSYLKQITELGGKVKRLDVSKLISNNSKKKK